jgi:hypothetical protein
MKTFSQLRSERSRNESRSSVKKNRYDNLKSNLLEKYRVVHESELSESEFVSFLNELRQKWSILAERKSTMFDSLDESKITSEEEFKSYAEKVLKKAHGDNYDQDIVDDLVSGLMKKYKGDYGAMVGALQAGLGESFTLPVANFKGKKAYQLNCSAQNPHILKRRMDEETKRYLSKHMKAGEYVVTLEGNVFEKNVIDGLLN